MKSFEQDLDYKNLYIDLKEKYNKLKTEYEELKLDIKIKDNELNNLRKILKSKENIIRLNFNSFDKKDFSCLNNEESNNNNLDTNEMNKHYSKKYETYSVDSFRNEMEQGNDLLNELIKDENDEIKLKNINFMKELFEIEKRDNFQILTNKKNIKTLIMNIDDILLNIKKKKESLYQTQKMLNLKCENKQ